MKAKIIGALIIIMLVISIIAVVIVGASKYWEEPFSTEGLEGATGFTIMVNFMDGTSENVRLLDSLNPFEIWNRHGEDTEIESITVILAVKASGRGHTTVQIQEIEGNDVQMCTYVRVSPPEGVDRQTLTEYEGYLYKGAMHTPVDVDTTFDADGEWHTIAEKVLNASNLDMFIEDAIDPEYTVGDFFLDTTLSFYADASIIEIKSDAMDDWMTVDFPSDIMHGIVVYYRPAYGELIWDSDIGILD